MGEGAQEESRRDACAKAMELRRTNMTYLQIFVYTCGPCNASLHYCWPAAPHPGLPPLLPHPPG